MACRIKHLNKKTGITYVYESVSSWDKEKQQSRNKQICIGKLDSVTGVGGHHYSPTRVMVIPPGGKTTL